MMCNTDQQLQPLPEPRRLSSLDFANEAVRMVKEAGERLEADGKLSPDEGRVWYLVHEAQVAVLELAENK